MGSHTYTNSAIPAGTTLAHASPMPGGYVEVEHQNLSHYTKFLVPLVAAAAIAMQQLGDTASPWPAVALSVAVAVVQPVVTWGVPSNVLWLASWKFWANVAALVVQAAIAAVAAKASLDAVTGAQWITIVLTLLATISVAVLPNGPRTSRQVVYAGAPDILPSPVDMAAFAPDGSSAPPPSDGS